MITKQQFEQETQGLKPVTSYRCAAFWTQDFKIGKTVIRYSALNTWDGQGGIERTDLFGEDML